MRLLFLIFLLIIIPGCLPLQIDRVLEGVQSMVSSSMNAELTKPYTREEVDMAIKNMAPMTAPGPNRMPPFFY